MMEDFFAVINATVDLFKLEFTIYGFTFSLWQVLLFSVAVGIICFIISEVFLSE